MSVENASAQTLIQTFAHSYFATTLAESFAPMLPVDSFSQSLRDQRLVIGNACLVERFGLLT
jgi:hypothetical protein